MCPTCVWRYPPSRRAVCAQGFASGSLDEDAWAPREFVARGLEVFVSQSYSKNLGLYGERIGAINAICADADSATKCAARASRAVVTGG